MAHVGPEFDLRAKPIEVQKRYKYACAIAPSILAIHQNIIYVVLFAGIADGAAKPDSDIDIAAVYKLEPYNYQTHEAMLEAYRAYKRTLNQTPFVVHLVILPEKDIHEGQYSTSKNIREKGIILCHR